MSRSIRCLGILDLIRRYGIKADVQSALNWMGRKFPPFIRGEGRNEISPRQCKCDPRATFGNLIGHSFRLYISSARSAWFQVKEKPGAPSLLGPPPPSWRTDPRIFFLTLWTHTLIGWETAKRLDPAAYDFSVGDRPITCALTELFKGSACPD